MARFFMDEEDQKLWKHCEGRSYTHSIGYFAEDTTRDYYYTPGIGCIVVDETVIGDDIITTCHICDHNWCDECDVKFRS